MKRVWLLIALVLLGYGLKEWSGGATPPNESVEERATAESLQRSPAGTDDSGDSIGNDDPEADASAERLQQAFAQRESNLQIESEGVVVKVLKDDTQGSPHQRFLLRTGTGQTLLVAHNIELAPRIVDIAEGDTVRFYGEYEWNEKGGVIHWTHHDPGGDHPDGWLEHRGQRYQ